MDSLSTDGKHLMIRWGQLQFTDSVCLHMCPPSLLPDVKRPVVISDCRRTKTSDFSDFDTNDVTKHFLSFPVYVTTGSVFKIYWQVIYNYFSVSLWKIKDLQVTVFSLSIKLTEIKKKKTAWIPSNVNIDERHIFIFIVDYCPTGMFENDRMNLQNILWGNFSMKLKSNLLTDY